MRVVIAMMKHETNTFSPVPTPLGRFRSFGTDDGPSYGDAAITATAGTNTIMAGFIDLAREAGAEIVAPIAALGLPSGPVHADAYEHMSRAILSAVQNGCDALFLDLHGAMVSESTDDGEGTLLRRIREIAPDLPIAVGLDLHCNLTEDIVSNCTAIVGYKTYPHIDMYDTGVSAGRIVLRAMRGEITPVMAWGNRPLMPHTLCMGTDDVPMRELIDMTREAESRGVLVATVFGGFPMADMHEAGLSVVIVADGDMNLARRERDRILDRAWDVREGLAYRAEPLSDSVARAKQLTEGPILLIDHGDNAASGGTQDTISVLREVMRQGLEDVAAFSIADPDAVTQMIAAGVGARVRVSLGGKWNMPAINLVGDPMEVDGTVRVISNGEFITRGPVYTGMLAKMGRTVVLDTGSVEIVVTERQFEPWDLSVLRSVGIEPSEKRFLLLKSRIHYRGAFLPIARHVVECDGVGVTSADGALFPYRKLRRPIYPLDADAAP